MKLLQSPISQAKKGPIDRQLHIRLRKERSLLCTLTGQRADRNSIGKKHSNQVLLCAKKGVEEGGSPKVGLHLIDPLTQTNGRLEKIRRTSIPRSRLKWGQGRDRP